MPLQYQSSTPFASCVLAWRGQPPCTQQPTHKKPTSTTTCLQPAAGSLWHAGVEQLEQWRAPLDTGQLLPCAHKAPASGQSSLGCRGCKRVMDRP